MSRETQMAINACEHWIGHETAHLPMSEQIAVYEALSRECDVVALRLKHELADTSTGPRE